MYDTNDFEFLRILMSSANMGPSTKETWHDQKRGYFPRSSVRSVGLTKTCPVRTTSKLLSNERRGNYICGNTDYKVERPDVFCRHWCFLRTRTEEVLSMSRKRKPHQKYLEITQTPSGIVQSTNKAKVHIQELGTYLYVKLLDDSLSVHSVGRSCDQREVRRP